MGARILVTGVAGVQGARVASALAARAGVEAVIGLDTRAPVLARSAGVEHVEADLRTQDVGRILRPLRLTAIVHTDVLQFPEPGRTGRQLHDINVVGTLGLLTAAGTLPGLEAVVVQGSAAVYGGEPTAPAFWREADLPVGARRELLVTRFQRDVAEIEQLVDIFARRHPDVACTTLRLQPVVGGELDTPITRLVRSPVVPTYLGFDPRLQVLHLDDATTIVSEAVLRGVRGTVNAAAPGPITLSLALRRMGRQALPLAGPLYGPVVGAVARLGGMPRLTPDMERYLRFGRAVDITRQTEELGVTCAHDTLEALLAGATESAAAAA